jgi:hypothetical protein
MRVAIRGLKLGPTKLKADQPFDVLAVLGTMIGTDIVLIAVRPKPDESRPAASEAP